MGYFDSVKNQPAASVVTAPSNVIQLRENLHPYARAIRDAWLGRLDDLERPWVNGAAWDSNCFVTARKLIELANSPWSGYKLNEAEADYLEHAPYDSVWDKRDKCWRQALGKAQGVALAEPDPQTPIPVVTAFHMEEQVAAMLGPPLNPIIDWEALFGAEDEGEEWIIEPLLPARRMVALYSAPKAGKSLLMLELAVAMARGTKVLGSPMERPYRVLYVDFENDPQGDIRTRLEAMGEADATQLENLCYLTFPALAKFDTAQGAIDLMRHVEHYACEVVVIDTVSRAVAGEENENDTWLSFYRHTGLSLKRAGIACIRLDHSGKDREKGMRGGSAKYGDVDAVWRLTALNDTTIHLECTDNRMPVPVKAMTLVRQDFPLCHIPAGDSWQAVADAKTQWADQRLDALGVPNSASVREAGKALREAGDKVENRAVREAVRFRKLRLDVPSATVSTSVPGTPPAHSGTPGGSVPGTAPPKGAAGTPPAAVPKQPGTATPETTGQDHSDPNLLVSCKNCFKPTTNGVARMNAGLCASCARTAGLEDA